MPVHRHNRAIVYNCAELNSPDGTRIVGAGLDETSFRVLDSLPYRDRFAKRLASGAEGEQAVKLLNRLLAIHGDWTEVADAVRNDAGVGNEVRNRALGIITTRAENKLRDRAKSEHLTDSAKR